jgi:hypothetical protein
MTILCQHVPHFQAFMLGAEGFANSFSNFMLLCLKAAEVNILFEW